MSKHLAINTQVDTRSYNNCPSQWQQQQQQQSSTDSARDVAALARQKHQDTLYEEDEDEDEEEEEDDVLDDGSTFTSSPSIPDENINFDLVYALHTFVATVEGQASVMKGDSLTLLDDTNSYWWLVSVLKTSEVGYIPAENIETPYERLARLNKYRNSERPGIDQSMHDIPEEQLKKKSGPQRRVTLSKDLCVQAQIILIGDDGEQEVGEAYEEWEEDMVDDDSDMSDESSVDDEQEEEEEEEGEKNEDVAPANKAPGTIGTGPYLSPHTTQYLPPPAPLSSEPPTQPSSGNGGRTNVVAPPSHPGPTAISATPAAANVTETRPPVSTFWRLFSRAKKDSNIRPTSGIPARVSSEDTPDSESISSSVESSIISEDRSTRHPVADTSNRNPSQLAVLRVFAGNVNVGAMYHSMLVDDNTSAEQLLIQAMERFHIAQIENKTAGRSSSSRTITPTNGSGIEYYLTVKPMNGDEITLDGEDKPLEIFRSLTAQLTTPMPSLTHIKQLSHHLSGSENYLSDYVRHRPAKTRYGEDAFIRFYLHKRIRRVNESAGQVYVKVCLYTGNGSTVRNNDFSTAKSAAASPSTTASTAAELARSTFSTKNLRRKKQQTEPAAAAVLLARQQERIDKLIAIPANVTIADLTEIALDKFHIVPNNETDHYRMGVSTQQMSEKLLSPSTKLIEVLHDDAAPRNTHEKLFILRKTHVHSRTSSRENQLQQQQRNSQISQENGISSRYQRFPMSISNFDDKTSEILQRINSTLRTIGNQNSSNRGSIKGSSGTTAAATTSNMAIVYNAEGRMDIIIACGALSSRSLNRTQTEYSVFARLDETGKLGLVVQKVIQIPSNRPVGSGRLANVTEQDIDTLFTFMRTYMNTHDRKINRKPVPAQDSDIAPTLNILNPPTAQGSSLNDLEKEFQRIIAAHAI